MICLFEQSEEIILASASPRRLELLSQVGLAFSVQPAHVDETPLPNEPAKEMVERLAYAKAVAGDFPGWRLGADTTVVLDGEVLGKPDHEAHAQQMLGRLQGRMHEVWGAFCLFRKRDGRTFVQSHMSRVWIVPMSADEIARYVATREPMDKAGSYAIQGLGTQLVSRVEGSYTNVVGLNVAACVAAMRTLGIVGPSPDKSGSK